MYKQGIKKFEKESFCVDANFLKRLFVGGGMIFYF